MINQDKMEALLLGNNTSNSLDLGKIEIKKSIKILGGYFTYNSLLSTLNQPRNLWEICLKVGAGKALQ